MKRIFNTYIDTFKGLSKEVWWLALITLVNRAGTMIIPFLSLYLTKGLNFSLEDVGWIMTAYGFGSVVGSWLGGQLTNTLGHYKTMVWSMFLTGLAFIGLQFLTTFEGFCIGLFTVMIIADAFRPAMFVALSSYSKPENKTRSVTLIRLAINLGFSAGPIAGGFIITYMSYTGLFWIDGLTCLAASLMILKILHPKKAQEFKEDIIENPKSPYTDGVFWIFFVAMALFAVVFLQYFSTVPLYYKEVILMSEFEIGLLMGMNGAVIFILEMPLIKWIEKKSFTLYDLMIFGAVLTGLSIIILNTSDWFGVIIIGMLLMSVGEMIAFPFSNAFAMQRSKRGNPGSYMALYSISFSVAHIFGHNFGMQMIEKYGYTFTWNIISILSVVCVGMLGLLKYKVQKSLKPQSA